MEESILSLKYEGSDLPEPKAKHKKHSDNNGHPSNKVWLKTRKRIRRRLLEGR